MTFRDGFDIVSLQIDLLIIASSQALNAGHARVP
jgi:hypothetical protein